MGESRAANWGMDVGGNVSNTRANLGMEGGSRRGAAAGEAGDLMCQLL